MSGGVSPRPQNDSIENNDEHHRSPEPLGPDDSVPNDSVYSRPSVFLRLITVAMLAVVFGTVAFH